MTKKELSAFFSKHFYIDFKDPIGSYLLIFAFANELVQYINHGFRFPQSALRIKEEDLKLKYTHLWKDSLLSMNYSEFNDFYNSMRKYDLEAFMIAFGFRGYLAQGVEAIPTLEALIQDELEKIGKAGIEITIELPRLLVLARRIHITTECATDILQQYSSNANTILSVDTLTKIYEATNVHPFDQVRSKTSSIAYQAVKLLRNAGCTDEFILEKYLDSQCFRKESDLTAKGSLKGIMNPSHYIRAVKGLSPNIDIGIEDTINQAMELMVKIKQPTQFLGALLVDSHNDDTALGCGLVRNRFLLQCDESSCILLINPSPYFLQIWPERLHKNTRCCVTSSLLCTAYSQEFPDMIFQTPDLFISNHPYPDHDRVLYFSSNAATEFLEIYNSYLTQCSSMSTKSPIHIMGIIPTNTLDQSLDYRKTISTYDLSIISLLPLGVSLSIPRRKSFVWCANNISRHGNYLECYEFFNLTGKRGSVALGRCTGDMATIQLSAAELINLPDGKTIHDAQRFYHHIREHAGQMVNLRSPAKGVTYSPEITIWYKASEIKAKSPDDDEVENFFIEVEHSKRYKIEAEVYRYPTQKELKRNEIPRGKAIKGSYASKVVYSESEAAIWLAHTAPYRSRIHDAMVTAFHAGRTPIKSKGSRCTSPLLDGPLSLRTVWYISLDLKRLIDKDRTVLLEKEIAESDVGLLRLGIAEERDFEREMESLFEACGATVDVRKRMWNTLSGILNQAKLAGYCKDNPVEKIAKSYRARHTSESDIRENLTKKTFASLEMTRLFESLLNLLDQDWRYIGCMLRLFYGMPANVICALCWGDLHITTSIGNTLQIWPQGQVNNNGSAFIPFDTAEDYRRIPLISIIATRLLHRRDEIRRKFSISVKDMNKQYILLSDEQLAENPNRIPSPRILNELTRTLVATVGIPEDIIILPDDGTGTKESNLASYGGDIFRSNFDYHARNTFHLEMGELNFLLNRQQKDTYEKHYCDYNNDAIQLQMLVAIEDWYKKLIKKEVETATQRSFHGTTDWLVYNEFLTAADDFDLYAYVDLDVDYDVNCLTGMDITAKLIKQEE